MENNKLFSFILSKIIIDSYLNCATQLWFRLIDHIPCFDYDDCNIVDCITTNSKVQLITNNNSSICIEQLKSITTITAKEIFRFQLSNSNNYWMINIIIDVIVGNHYISHFSIDEFSYYNNQLNNVKFDEYEFTDMNYYD